MPEAGDYGNWRVTTKLTLSAVPAGAKTCVQKVPMSTSADTSADDPFAAVEDCASRQPVPSARGIPRPIESLVEGVMPLSAARAVPRSPRDERS